MAEISARAAVVAALALVALVLAGRRKPARPWRRAPRGGDALAIAVTRRGERILVPVQQGTFEFERRMEWWRRVLSLGGLGATAAVLGTLIAIVLAAGVAIAIGTLTDLLR
jgi:hypothetical protein